MPTLPTRRPRALLIALLLAAGCESDGTTPVGPGPSPLLPIADGNWFLNSVNSSALPAKVSERFIGVTLEEVYVDSAQLVINNFTDSYQQRYWTRVMHSGVEDRREFVYDEGLFSIGSGAYVFNSTVRSRTFTLTTPGLTLVRSAEQMATHNGADVVAGDYARTRP